jgi:hypothetical protein
MVAEQVLLATPQRDTGRRNPDPLAHVVKARPLSAMNVSINDR